jgi:hypothetical protein
VARRVVPLRDRAVQKNSMSVADHVGTCSLSVWVDEPCTAASERIPLARRIAVARSNQHISAPDITSLSGGSFSRLLQQSLSAADAEDDGRNILCIDESVEVFRASKIGKVNDVVRYLRNFAAHFLSGSQVELYTFSGAALEKTDDGDVPLESGLILSERRATCVHRYNSYEKKQLLFHDCSF